MLAGLSIVALAIGAWPVQPARSASPEADLSLAKSADSQVPAVGQDVTFTLAVSNGGPDPASGVRVTDLLPAGLAYVSDDGGGAYDRATGVWDVGALSPTGSASTATLEIVATVTGTTAVDNYAEVTASDQTDPDSTAGDSSTTEDDDDSVTVTGQPSVDLSLTKTVDIPLPETGQQVTFTLTVTNSGSVDASVVQVTDLLPGGLLYVSHADGSYNSATGVWDASPVAAGDQRTLQIVAIATSTTRSSTGPK